MKLRINSPFLLCFWILWAKNSNRAQWECLSLLHHVWNSTAKTWRLGKAPARVWNHLPVHALTYLLLGQEDWETRTANSSDYAWPLLAARLGDSGLEAMFSESQAGVAPFLNESWKNLLSVGYR